MPRRCSIIGCRSNYDTETERFSTFGLPKAESERFLWLKKIPTDISKLKNPSVCVKHFRNEDVIRFDILTVKGERKVYPRQVPKLKEGAVPCIFPDEPKYLSSAPISSRRLADIENDRLEAAVKESLVEHKKYLEKDKISNVWCELHLKHEDVMQHIDCFEEKSGKRGQVRLDYPCPRPGAVPAKLPACADFPRSKTGTARKRPLLEKQREGAKAIKKAIVRGQDKDQCKSEQLKNVSTPKVLSVNELKKENNYDNVTNGFIDEISIEPEEPNIFENFCYGLLPIKNEPLETEDKPLETVSEHFEMQCMNYESTDSNTSTTQLDQSPIFCKVCHTSFQENNLLIEHLYTHIRNQSKNVIDVISNDCELQQSTQLSNTKNFVCNVCGANFHMEFLLENHCICHLKNIDFACEFCGETFESKSLFDKHHKLHIVKPSFEKLQKLHVVKPSLENNQALLIVEPSFEKLQKLHVVKPSLENNQTLLIVEPSFEKFQKLHVVKPSSEKNQTIHIIKPSLEKNQTLHIVKPSLEKNQTLHVAKPLLEKHQKLHVVKPSLEKNRTLHIKPLLEKHQKLHVVKPSLEKNRTLHIKPLLEKHQKLHVVKPSLEKNRTLHIKPSLEKHQKLHSIEPNVISNQECKKKEQPIKSPFVIYIGYKDGDIPKETLWGHTPGDEQNSDSD